MNMRLKSIPKFRNEAEERRFWETHNSTNYVDWSKSERVRLPNLKPSTTSISLRLPVTLLERIKVAACTHLSFLLVRLGALAAGCFRGNRRIRRASDLSGVRCSGLREPDAGLITIGKLHARDL